MTYIDHIKEIRTGDSVRASLGDSVYFWGQHEVGWLSFYEYFSRIGIYYKDEDNHRLKLFNDLAKSCMWWWPYQNIVVACERPKKIHRDTLGRLHNENGMAISFRDTWGVYAIHGVRVPEYIVMEPNKITVKLIEEENNAEIRRVMIERYGLSNYLIDSGAKLIDRDETAVADPIELYRKDIPGDEPLVMIKVINSTAEPDGTFKNYFLRVPPDTTKALDALAWTFNLNPKQYKLTMET